MDNQAYKEEPELESKEKFVGSNKPEEWKPFFIIKDIPIPFSYSTLTLPIDF